MNQDEAPHIEYPCRYPIKVIGEDVDDYSNEIIRIIRVHAPDLKDEDISFRPSRHGKYLAVNVIIVAHGEKQIEAIFNDLKASGRTAMVL
jgi:putative lipoic acid-binding regulatory protein